MKVSCDLDSSAVELPLLGTSVNELMAGVTGGILFLDKLLHFSRKLEMSKELPWVQFVARGSISSLGLGEFLEVDLFFLIMFILRL